MTGMAAGAAAAGLRPICHLMYGNFVYTGFDALANQVAKLRYMTGGQISLPATYIAVAGGGRSAAAQHSDSVHPLFMNLGGIKVVMPTTPADAKGLMKSCIRDDNPTLFLIPVSCSGLAGEVPEEDYLLPLGRSAVLREGHDVTLVAIGSMARPALAVAEEMAGRGISVEVIDPRTLVPIDTDTILASLAKTGRLVIADEARDCCSAASHIAAVAADRGFASLRAPVRRITVPDTPIPYSPVLEKHLLPNAGTMAAAIRSVFGEGMKVTLKIPRLSMNMEQATVVEWFKQPGERFAEGEALYAVETEKVTNDVEAPGAGVLLEILIPAGTDCTVGDAVCRVESI